MASITIVTTTCDFPHDGDTEALETITITWEGKALEADVCDSHSAALYGALGPYIEAARPVKPAAAKREKRTMQDRHRSREIRAWARGEGLFVDDRGRIPADIIAAYDKAH